MRSRSGAVIALSGLDGAGKSTQGLALVAALERAGHPAVTQWQRISQDRSLQWLTAPLRLVLRLVLRLRPSVAPRTAVAKEGFEVLPEHQAARALRERLPRVNTAWVTLVAVLHAASVRRATRRETRLGRIVVRDRYVLDSVVHLRDRYAKTRGVARQAWLIRRISPAPLCAFYLDVSAAEAFRRTPEEYSVAQLEAQRQGYLREAGRLGVRVVDAEQPVEQIATEILRQVQVALAARGLRPAR